MSSSNSTTNMDTSTTTTTFTTSKTNETLQTLKQSAIDTAATVLGATQVTVNALKDKIQSFGDQNAHAASVPTVVKLDESVNTNTSTQPTATDKLNDKVNSNLENTKLNLEHKAANLNATTQA